MFLYLLFFISSLTLGLFVLKIFKIYPYLNLRLASAFIIGTSINLLTIFLLAFVFGLNFTTSFITVILSLLVSLIFLKKAEAIKGLEKIKLAYFLPLIALLPIISVIFIIFYNSIFVSEDSIIAGNRLVWVDWPVHISLISSFVNGNNFPPQNPLHSQGITTYPFVSDFLSAILQSLGATLKSSLIAPGIIFGITIVALLYNFGRQFFEKRLTAILAVYIGLFWGGIGFLYFLEDLISSQNFVNTILFPPKEYTFLTEKNLWFFTFLYSELLPQRAFLLGMPITLTSLTFLVWGITKVSKAKIIVAAYLIGILPFIHMHSYISALIVSLSYIALTLVSELKDNFKKVKELIFLISLYFILPILGLGLIQIPIFMSVAGNSFGLHLGFLKGQENFFIFWFKNTGLFWPLWILGFFLTKNKIAKNILLASVPLFILPNIFRFAPWPYDNLKIFTYWYLIGSFAVATALTKLWFQKTAGKIITVILLLSLTLSGSLEIIRIANPAKTRIPLWNRNDIEMSKVIKEKTEPESIILTAAVHDHPVTSLAGRKIIIGFPGNAWSWGYSDWYKREQDVREIFQGNPTTAAILLEKYQVDYVMISPREKVFEPRINENYFLQKLDQVAVGPDYKIFKVK